VCVVGLHRKVQDAKPLTRGRRNGSTHFAKKYLSAKRGQSWAGSKRDVEWMALQMLRTHRVRHSRSRPDGFSTRTRAPPAPRPKNKLLLPRTRGSKSAVRSQRHLDSAIVLKRPQNARIFRGFGPGYSPGTSLTVRRV
jgi:hypothetical protein